MAEKFEIWITDDDGDTWTKIKDDIEGEYPCGKKDLVGREWCFYYADDDLMMIYSDDQGENWSTPVAIIADIDKASLSFEVDEFGFHWISYWKGDKAYSAFHNPSDDPDVWTSKEVKE